jgi:hypothetical protein
VEQKKKWFFLNQNNVTGPLRENEISALHENHLDGLIWGAGLSEWQPYSEWYVKIQLLKEVLESLQVDMTPTWWMRDDQAEKGPMTYHKIIQLLKSHRAAGDIEIKQDPSTEWLSIYDYPAIIEEVGVSRREHERAPFAGVFRFQKAGQVFETQVTSISEGGLGLSNAPYLSTGDLITGSLHSPMLAAVIHFEVEVLYQRRDSTWGLRFHQISHENKSLVLSYIKKFSSAYRIEE